jgi:hypothetical protein
MLIEYRSVKQNKNDGTYLMSEVATESRKQKAPRTATAVKRD